MKSLGDRMKKNYEDRQRFYLVRRTPVIVRVDGVAFHTFTRKYPKFSEDLNWAMVRTSEQLLKRIQGAQCAFVQSDEISVLLVDYKRFVTDAWFDNNIQKICSVSAAMAATHFNYYIKNTSNRLAYFDGRAFNIPRHDVTNYFVWRQRDWITNSVQMLAQMHFSQKQMQNKSCAELKKMVVDEGHEPWVKLDNKWKYGTLIVKTTEGEQTIFSEHHTEISKHRELIEPLLEAEEE